MSSRRYVAGGVHVAITWQGAIHVASTWSVAHENAVRGAIDSQ